MNPFKDDLYSIWHPFTQHQTAKAPICIASAKGALMIDEHGNEIIDAVSSWWTNIFGHCNSEIAQSIKSQVDTLEHVLFSGFTHQPAIQLSNQLLAILPSSQKKVFFSDNGSTAVEVALKMSIQYWYNKGIEKQTFIAFKDAYHGDTFGAMSVGARGVFNQAFESLFFDVAFIDLPNASNFNQVITDFQQIIRDKNVAAFIFEPLLLGSAGMMMYESIYLDKLIQVAKNECIICIADEVLTGIGRTGKNFACDYLTEQPDIMCISKGITGGFMPLGLTTCTREIYDAFLSSDKLKTFFHGHSYTGNPLACAAANATLQILSASETLIAQLVKWQSAHTEHLKSLMEVENVRQIGTIVAFDVCSEQQSNYFNNLRDFLYDSFLERGVLLRPLGNTVYVMPPYVISEEQLKKVYAVIREVVQNLPPIG